MNKPKEVTLEQTAEKLQIACREYLEFHKCEHGYTRESLLLVCAELDHLKLFFMSQMVKYSLGVIK